MNVLLSGGTGLSNFACSAEDCLSWIIVLLCILTVFYLAFCAWFKKTKFIRIIGWIWSVILIGGTVYVVAKHTCIFTILSAVFSGMVAVAVISIAMNKGTIDDTDTYTVRNVWRRDKRKKLFISGSYVVSETNNVYEFSVRDDGDKVIAKSYQKYRSESDVKAAVNLCRNYVYYADAESHPQRHIENKDYPKFEIYTSGGKYYFLLFVMPNMIMLQSVGFKTVSACTDALRRLIVIAKSGEIRYEK